MTDPRLDIVWSPLDQGDATDQYIKELEKTKAETGTTGVPMCIPALDDLLKPGHRSTIRTVLGRPGHAKSSLMLAHARSWGKVIQRTGRRSCVVYATAETMAEHLNIMLAAQYLNVAASDIIDLKLDDRQRRLLDEWNFNGRAELPIFVIGKSFVSKGKSAALSPRYIGEAVQAIQEHYGLFPELVLVDYLQILKPDDSVRIRNSDTKTTLIGENMSALKQWAQDTKTFWEVGIQAGRQVDEVDPPMPDQGDAQWASQIEQDTDSGISIMRPIKYLNRGNKPKLKKILEDQGISTNIADPKIKEVLERVAIVSVWKQRMGGVGSKLIKFDPRYLEANNWELADAIPDEKVQF